jgi:SPP1 family predicted phage head-tail adaptor
MILNGKMSNPGEMRTFVTFQNPTLSEDASGAQVAAWADAAAVWVKWVNAHGQEAANSDALKSVQRATVTMRYLSSISALTSLLKSGERWQVISLDNIQERSEYLELVVERAKGTV